MAMSLVLFLSFGKNSKMKCVLYFCVVCRTVHYFSMIFDAWAIGFAMASSCEANLGSTHHQSGHGLGIHQGIRSGPGDWKPIGNGFQMASKWLQTPKSLDFQKSQQNAQLLQLMLQVFRVSEFPTNPPVSTGSSSHDSCFALLSFGLSQG